MKNLTIILFVAIIIISFIAFRSDVISGIQGSIDPPQGAKKVTAISGSDSVSVIPAGGHFSIQVKQGTWRLSVEAVAPYKSEVLENIVVQPEQFTDVGVIKLSEK